VVFAPDILVKWSRKRWRRENEDNAGKNRKAADNQDNKIAKIVAENSSSVQTKNLIRTWWHCQSAGLN
jgi:hypothetical protein